MDSENLSLLMQQHGIKPTANRIIIASALAEAGRPLSMTELEEVIGTIDKSGIFRTLMLFRDSHLVHVLEDSRYELCYSEDDHHDDDVHVHFHCTRCDRTYCLEDTPVPDVRIPDGFEVETVSYMVHGVCSACKK